MALLKRITFFEDLSSELFFEIFDFFSFIELYNTFGHLNRRIDDYLSQFPNIYLNILPEKNTLNTKLNERQVLCVKSIRFQSFVRKDPSEMHKLFIQYPLKLFQQLRSLWIEEIISTTEIPIIIDQLPLLPNLTRLIIMFNLFQKKLTKDDLQYAKEIIFRSCIKLKTLKFTIRDDLDPRKRIHNAPLFKQPITNNIEHLYVYTLYFDEFDRILSPLFFPQLKSLHATICDNPKQQDYPNERFSLDFLVYLSLNFNWYVTFAHLESIFKRTPNLKTFVLSCSPVTLIDCQKWQYLLSKYLSKLVKFHVHACDWEERGWFKTNEYMNFLTSTYWFEERGGIIQTNYKQVLDELGNEVDSIFVHFTTMTFKNWKKQCSYCYRY